MADDVEILSLGDRERWEAETSDGGLPSQSWSYAWGLAASGYNPKLAIVRCRGSRLLLPFVERNFMGTTDIATVPGLSGASIVGSEVHALFTVWRKFAIDQGWVAGYIQLATSVALHQPPSDSELVAHNAVFLFDLATDLPLEPPSRTARRKLKMAKNLGVGLVEDRCALVRNLKSLYPRAMQRLEACEVYSSETLERWAEMPTSCLTGASLDGRIEAVALGFVAGSHAEGYIAATSEAGRALTAYIFWQILRGFRERGAFWANIGGGARVGDGVYQFKKWLGGTGVPLRSLRQIYDAKKYAELCKHARTSRDGIWFPAYRARAASQALAGDEASH